MDYEQAISYLMRRYGWSCQEATEYYNYEPYDPADWEAAE